MKRLSLRRKIYWLRRVYRNNRDAGFSRRISLGDAWRVRHW